MTGGGWRNRGRGVRSPLATSERVRRNGRCIRQEDQPAHSAPHCLSPNWIGQDFYGPMKALADQPVIAAPGSAEQLTYRCFVREITDADIKPIYRAAVRDRSRNGKSCMGWAAPGVARVEWLSAEHRKGGRECQTSPPGTPQEKPPGSQGAGRFLLLRSSGEDQPAQ